jgi:hypothetical protein
MGSEQPRNGEPYRVASLDAIAAIPIPLDGEEFDAPAGTLVFVRDPSVHRHAVAVEAGTEVLAFGGDPVFQPAGDEWIWRIRPLLPDDPERAQALVDSGLAEAPDNPGGGS